MQFLCLLLDGRFEFLSARGGRFLKLLELFAKICQLLRAFRFLHLSCRQGLFRMRQRPFQALFLDLEFFRPSGDGSSGLFGLFHLLVLCCNSGLGLFQIFLQSLFVRTRHFQVLVKACNRFVLLSVVLLKSGDLILQGFVFSSEFGNRLRRLVGSGSMLLLLGLLCLDKATILSLCAFHLLVPFFQRGLEDSDLILILLSDIRQFRLSLLPVILSLSQSLLGDLKRRFQVLSLMFQIGFVVLEEIVFQSAGIELCRTLVKGFLQTLNLCLKHLFLRRYIHPFISFSVQFKVGTHG
mmetsp:Transcript_809/g.1384  ORF Transcript_809/g.1384 Transcript_809/m.1384 type:complete len:295 (+) Transcript_809:1342-2226(+)